MTAEVRKPKGDINSYWDNFDWDELNEAEKKCFAELGWNKEIWDGEGSVPAEEKDWTELSDSERLALESLGYSQATWDD